MKILFSIISLILSFVLNFNIVLADTATGGCLVTKVGNPDSNSLPANCQSNANPEPGPGNPPLPTPGGNSNSALVNAGLDVKAAFTSCDGNTGDESSAENACFAGFLSRIVNSGGQRRYTDQQIAAFNQSRAGGYNDTGEVQCIGYVAVSLALLTGDPYAVFRGDSTANTRSISAAYELRSLNELLICPGGDCSHSYVYHRVADSSFAPGDIGSANVGGDRGAVTGLGHALIVDRITNDGFWALENGWPTEGTVTQDIVKHDPSAYVLFRK